MGISAMQLRVVLLVALVGLCGRALGASPEVLSADEPELQRAPHAQAFISEMETPSENLSAEDEAKADAFEASRKAQKLASTEVQAALKAVQNVHTYVKKKEFELNGATTQDEAHKVYKAVRKRVKRHEDAFMHELDKKTTEYDSHGKKVSGRLSPSI